MYPAELEIKDTTESTTSASYLDLLLSIGRDGQLHTSICDKRDDFNFHITNFPFLSSNIPSSPAYGVFISQLIRYARACSSYECFILRARRLSSKLLKQGYLVERLKSPLRKFYGRYGDRIQQYEVSLSRMLNDILTLDQQWLPNQSDFPLISLPWYRLWPSPNYEWFPWSICNGCGLPAGNAYPSGHLVPSPILGLAGAPIVGTKFLELAMSLLDFSPHIPLGTFSILLLTFIQGLSLMCNFYYLMLYCLCNLKCLYYICITDYISKITEDALHDIRHNATILFATDIIIGEVLKGDNKLQWAQTYNAGLGKMGVQFQKMNIWTILPI